MRTDLASGGFEVAGFAIQPGTRGFTWLPVARLLMGAELRLPVHIVHGRESGPVLGLTAVVHGVEYLPVLALQEALRRIVPEQLRGTVICVPVCNPLALAAHSRITLSEEDIDFANLNRVFPGARAHATFGSGGSHSSDRTLTEMIAETLVRDVLSRLTHLLDFHCHFAGAALVKVILGELLDGQQGADSRAMALAFGTGLIHQHTLTANTLGGQAEQRGVAVCIPEIGGGGLSAAVEMRCVEMTVEGILNVVRYLRMLPGAPAPAKRHLVFYHTPHVRPTTAGYLLSDFDPDRLFAGPQPGVPVQRGQVLGRVFDPYTFEEQEALISPVDGVLYLTRRSGPVETGAHAFAVANVEGAAWIEEAGAM